MSKQSKKQKNGVTLGPFGGIDARAPHTGTPTTYDVVNFRPGTDGSLIKRCGYRPFLVLANAVHTVWAGKLCGSNYIFLLTETTVIRVHPATWSTKVIGKISKAYDHAQFCFYRDRLYLFVNEEIYQIDENSLSPVEAYAPLIGKDWTSTYVGPIHEPRNLLTRRARIEYLVEERSSVFFRTAWQVESIEAIYVDDRLLGTDEYRYDDPSRSIVIQGLEAGTRVRVYLTYLQNDDENQTQQLLSCSRVDVFGDSANNRLFLWNGNQKNVFFPSIYVSSESLAASRLQYAESTPLYFVANNECILGDGRYDITGFVRQYDRLLVFTEGDTWMMDTEALSESRLSAKPIHPFLGCDTVGAYTMAENAPITVCQNNVYQWSADTDEYSECNARSIANPIRPLLDDTFLSEARVFYYRAEGEIWLYSPQGDSVWIYRVSDGIWYRFSNIQAESFFEFDNRVFFVYGDRIYAFHPNYYEDMDATNTSHAICASYTSNLIDYGTFDDKHFAGLSLNADCDGGTVEVSLTGDGLTPIRLSFSDSRPHTMAYRRLHSGRFQYATLQILADGYPRQIIHSLVSDVR